MTSAKQLRPPATTAPTDSSRSHASRYVLVAFVLLLVLGLGVMLLLPQWVAEKPRQAIPVTTDTVQQPAEVLATRQQAEKSLQAFLRLQAEMSLANAAVWGVAEWDAAESRVGVGDRLFGERRFGEAYRAYNEGLALLKKLKLERQPRLEVALLTGREALNQNQVAEALEQFSLALSIEPGRVEAMQGQARAQVRDQVLQAMATAGQSEADTQLQVARDAYQKAVSLDSAYEPAAIGLARVEQTLKQQAFQVAMDSALKALDAGRFSDAADALVQAAQINPQHQALLDARQRLQGARREAKLKQLRRQAEALEKSEHWDEAVKRYTKALKIDADAGFARQGLSQAKQRAALNAQFDRYLEQPERLYSKQLLQQAEQLLKATSGAPASEPGLAAKMGQLQSMVAVARQPLQLELRSDGKTQVKFFHIGRLGQFTSQRFSLRPGTYTVTGACTGYRDVRRVFSLKPGAKLTIVDIRCEERL